MTYIVLWLKTFEMQCCCTADLINNVSKQLAIALYNHEFNVGTQTFTIDAFCFYKIPS